MVSKWSIYLLYNEKTRRSYVGSTTDPTRRLRQHNGEISGGARSTRGGKWKLVGYLSGFADRSEACRWEKIIKGRVRGVHKRWFAIGDLWVGLQPPGRPYKLPAGQMALAYVEGLPGDE